MRAKAHIRPATASDAEGIIGVHYAAVQETAAYPPDVIANWSPPPSEARFEHIRRAIDSGDALLVIAEVDSAVVGFGSVVPDQNELRAVYVHPDFGRRGIGSLILNQLERLAVERGVNHLALDASINSEAFYRQHGYEVIERGSHRFGSGFEMACVKMRKRLVLQRHISPTFFI